MNSLNFFQAPHLPETPCDSLRRILTINFFCVIRVGIILYLLKWLLSSAVPPATLPQALLKCLLLKTRELFLLGVFLPENFHEIAWKPLLWFEFSKEYFLGRCQYQELIWVEISRLFFSAVKIIKFLRCFKLYNARSLESYFVFTKVMQNVVGE